jgi:hypothetical protein
LSKSTGCPHQIQLNFFYSDRSRVSQAVCGRSRPSPAGAHGISASFAPHKPSISSIDRAVWIKQRDKTRSPHRTCNRQLGALAWDRGIGRRATAQTLSVPKRADRPISFSIYFFCRLGVVPSWLYHHVV